MDRLTEDKISSLLLESIWQQLTETKPQQCKMDLYYWNTYDNLNLKTELFKPCSEHLRQLIIVKPSLMKRSVQVIAFARLHPTMHQTPCHRNTYVLYRCVSLLLFIILFTYFAKLLTSIKMVLFSIFLLPFMVVLFICRLGTVNFVTYCNYWDEISSAIHIIQTRPSHCSFINNVHLLHVTIQATQNLVTEM